MVTRSTPEPDTKHMLHVTNRLSAWFARHEIKMNDTGEIVPDVRCLARSIMRHVMGHHRRPDRPRRSLRLDHQRPRVPTTGVAPGSPEASNGVGQARDSSRYRRAVAVLHGLDLDGDGTLAECAHRREGSGLSLCSNG